jgi:hypothetical protein
MIKNELTLSEVFSLKGGVDAMLTQKIISLP